MIAGLASTQALTVAVPIGALAVVCIWGFFVRRPARRRSTR